VDQLATISYELEPAEKTKNLLLKMLLDI